MKQVVLCLKKIDRAASLWNVIHHQTGCLRKFVTKCVQCYYEVQKLCSLQSVILYIAKWRDTPWNPGSELATRESPMRLKKSSLATKHFPLVTTRRPTFLQKHGCMFFTELDIYIRVFLVTSLGNVPKSCQLQGLKLEGGGAHSVAFPVWRWCLSTSSSNFTTATGVKLQTMLIALAANFEQTFRTLKSASHLLPDWPGVRQLPQCSQRWHPLELTTAPPWAQHPAQWEKSFWLCCQSLHSLSPCN